VEAVVELILVQAVALEMGHRAIPTDYGKQKGSSAARLKDSTTTNLFGI